MDICRGQRRDPAGACVLAAPIRIHYFRLAIFCDSFPQRLNAKAGILRIGEQLGQNLKGHPINDCHKIQKAVLDGNVGNIAAPNLIGPRECELPQKVWKSTVLWILLVGVRPPICGLQPHNIHQSTNTMAGKQQSGDLRRTGIW